MRKAIIPTLALSCALFVTSCATHQHAGHNHEDHGIAINYMDTTVRPQDDFYNYVNGGWMKTAVIPSDKASWGSFNELREKTDVASLEILNNILNEKYPAGSEGQKIKDIYAQFTNWEQRNALGISPIKGDIAKVDAIANLQDLQKYLNEATKRNDNPLYAWRVGSDLKSSNDNAIYLGGPSLGLGRDYYQKENEANTKTLAEYKNYVASLLEILGYTNAGETAQKLVDLEKRFAKTLLTNEQNRDANLRYNPKTISELGELVKNVNLPNYLTTVGVDTNRVILGELNYYKNFDQFINTANLPLIKDYLKYNIIAGSAGSLDKRLDDLRFNFYSKYLQGQKEQRAMNKRGLEVINGTLGEAFGKLYVDKYFPAEAKAEMVTMIDYLKKSYREHIQNLDWMSAETKTKALDKLSKFAVKVAYPDKWEDYSKLTIKPASEGGTYYDNIQNISEWRYQKNLEKVGKKVDKTKWGMTPQTVNAYYSASNNEIVFPAGILQPPFFNFKADPAVNFGGIGAVIGHEISHGFDDGGSRFDGDGNLNNWWTAEDRKKFEAETKKLGEQYSKYEPVKGSFVNGTFTMGENIADLGGVAIAYDALQMYLKDKGNPGKISGYDQNQRFFMSWATVWRTKSTEKYLVNQVKTDPHAPGFYRAFGPLVNVNAFYDAFKVKEKDQHYKKPEERIKIW